MTPDTTQARPHPLAHILRAIADCQEVQFNFTGGGWRTVQAGNIFSLLGMYDEPQLWRIKPRTISINGHEVPAGERKAPTEGTVYFVPYLAAPGSLADDESWDGGETDTTRLARGLVHLTRENAELHARALLSFTEQPDA